MRFGRSCQSRCAPQSTPSGSPGSAARLREAQQMNALPGAGVDSGVCEETPQDLALLHPRDLLGFLRRREIELADRLSNLGIEPVADHPELLDPVRELHSRHLARLGGGGEVDDRQLG